MVPSYSLGQDYIFNRDNYKDLEINIDVFLKFHQHINNICGKGSDVAQSVLYGTVYRSVDFMKTAFITHVYPLLYFFFHCAANRLLGGPTYVGKSSE